MKVLFFTVHLYGQAFALNVMEMEQKVISLTAVKKSCVGVLSLFKKEVVK